MAYVCSGLEGTRVEISRPHMEDSQHRVYECPKTERATKVVECPNERNEHDERLQAHEEATLEARQLTAHGGVAAALCFQAAANIRVAAVFQIEIVVKYCLFREEGGVVGG